MRESRVLTRTIEIEPRQHTLLGLDLGDGPPRHQITLGAVATVLWLAIILPFSYFLLGGIGPNWGWLYVLPPGLITWYGWRVPERNPRRRIMTQWVLAIRWVMHGHEPVIALGRHHARSDAVRFKDRFLARWFDGDALAIALPGRLHAEKAQGRPAQPRSARHVTFSPVVQLQGNAVAQQIESPPTRRQLRPARSARRAGKVTT